MTLDLKVVHEGTGLSESAKPPRGYSLSKNPIAII